MVLTFGGSCYLYLQGDWTCFLVDTESNIRLLWTS